MTKAYSSAKAFDGTFTTVQKGSVAGKGSYSLNVTATLRYQAPNRFFVNASVVGTGIMSARSGRQIAVSDGVKIYVYRSTENQYITRPAPPAIPLVALLAQVGVALPRQTPPGATLASNTSVGGKPAFVVKLVPDLSKMPAGMPAAQRAALASPVLISIDQHTFFQLALHQASTMGSTDITAGRQTTTPSFSSASFAFTPPPGSKQGATPPPPMGAAPGMPRR